MLQEAEISVSRATPHNPEQVSVCTSQLLGGLSLLPAPHPDRPGYQAPRQPGQCWYLWIFSCSSWLLLSSADAVLSVHIHKCCDLMHRSAQFTHLLHVVNLRSGVCMQMHLSNWTFRSNYSNCLAWLVKPPILKLEFIYLKMPHLHSPFHSYLSPVQLRTLPCPLSRAVTEVGGDQGCFAPRARRRCPRQSGVSACTVPQFLAEI